MTELEWLPFEIKETRASERVTLSVQGELDVVVADELEGRLRELSREHATVELDLSRLQFIDSAGLRVILRAALDARKNGFSFEVRRDVSSQVARVLQLVQAERLLWPEI